MYVDEGMSACSGSHMKRLVAGAAVGGEHGQKEHPDLVGSFCPWECWQVTCDIKSLSPIFHSSVFHSMSCTRPSMALSPHKNIRRQNGNTFILSTVEFQQAGIVNAMMWLEFEPSSIHWQRSMMHRLMPLLQDKLQSLSRTSKGRSA